MISTAGGGARKSRQEGLRLNIRSTCNSYPAFPGNRHPSERLVIGKDGHIADVHVVSGPPALQRAALDAVKQWEYRPYLLNGQPVEVNTTVNVVFALSR